MALSSTHAIVLLGLSVWFFRELWHFRVTAGLVGRNLTDNSLVIRTISRIAKVFVPHVDKDDATPWSKYDRKRHDDIQQPSEHGMKYAKRTLPNDLEAGLQSEELRTRIHYYVPPSGSTIRNASETQKTSKTTKILRRTKPETPETRLGETPKRSETSKTSQTTKTEMLKIPEVPKRSETPKMPKSHSKETPKMPKQPETSKRPETPGKSNTSKGGISGSGEGYSGGVVFNSGGPAFEAQPSQGTTLEVKMRKVEKFKRSQLIH